MALIVMGRSTCSICGTVLQGNDQIRMFAAFLQPNHPPWRYSDSAVHEKCLEAWQYKEEFLAIYETFDARRRSDTVDRSSADRKIPFKDPAIESWYTCERCGQLVPKLQGVSKDELVKFESGGAITTIKHLNKELGISFAVSQLAVYHPHYCTPKPTATCPHCSETLRTDTAKQCRFCHADWH